MFYPELSTIENSELFSELIQKFDTWLALLPYSEQDKITVSKVSIKFNIDYEIAKTFLECCIKLRILEKGFAIVCPTCEHVLKISNEANLYDELSEINNCYACESDIEVSLDNIFIVYKLIKKPSTSPDKIKKLAEQRFLKDKINNKSNSLKTELSDNFVNPNSFFYNPNYDEQKQLKILLSAIKGPFTSTKSKGDSLEDLSIYLLNLVKCFRATKVIRSRTSQFDCFIRNKISFAPSIFQDIGSFFIAECKNENTTPGNTYYKKLIENLGSTGCKLGILFSVRKIAKTCNIISRESFLQRKIIVVNFYLQDLDDIVTNNRNFLDLLEAKINTIKLNSTTPLDDVNIYT